MSLPLPYETTTNRNYILADSPSWTEVQEHVNEGAILLVSNLAGAGWLADALDKGAQPSFSNAGLTGLRVKRGSDKRTTGWVVDRSLWGGLEQLSGERIHEHNTPEDTANILAVGSHPTPSGLGLASMSAWYDRSQPPLYRPPAACERIIRAGLVGGRVDTPRRGEQFEVLYEIDANSAYAWAAQRVPAGRCYAVGNGGARPDRAAFHYATARASPSLDHAAIGPLPVRQADGSLTYPTTGAWAGWYWSEEIEAARSVGYTVTPEYGWEWDAWSCGLRDWAERIHALRLDSAAEFPGCAALLKLCTVAGIGRLCGRETVYALTEEPTDRPYSDIQTGMFRPDGRLWQWYLREQQRSRPELLPHVASYINMRVRLATWERARAEGRSLVATNFDAVLSTSRPSWKSSTALGDWKWRELHPAERPTAEGLSLGVPYPRALISAEKRRLPGLTGAARAA